MMTEGVKAGSLEGMVDYQKGAVVSRTLMDKKSGTVTLFAFDKGQALSEHTTPYDAMVVILEGRGDIVISGSSNLLKKGDMIIMPADEPHALYATDRFKMMLTMLRS